MPEGGKRTRFLLAAVGTGPLFRPFLGAGRALGHRPLRERVSRRGEFLDLFVPANRAVITLIALLNTEGLYRFCQFIIVRSKFLELILVFVPAIADIERITPLDAGRGDLPLGIRMDVVFRYFLFRTGLHRRDLRD